MTKIELILQLTKEEIEMWCEENDYNLEHKVELNEVVPLSVKTIRKEGIPGIVERVSFHSNLNTRDLIKKCRTRKIVEPRQLSHYIAKKRIGLSLSDIAWNIGRMNHATILNSISNVQNLLDSDKSFCDKYANVITLYSLK